MIENMNSSDGAEVSAPPAAAVMDPGPPFPETVRFKPLETIFDNYLACTPLGHALFRAVEAGHMCRFRLERPVLEVGCGSGEFAKMALDDRVDVGMDLVERRLRRARRTGRYRELVCDDARCTALQSNSFRTVLAVSVLEHVSNPQALLAEAHRVLQAGGTFVATVVLADFHDCLVWPKIFRAFGGRRAASFCRQVHDRVFRHVTMLSEASWRGLLEHSGFEIVACERLLSRRATGCWDAMLATAWPYRLANMAGWRVVWRPRWLRGLAARFLRGLLIEDGRSGSCLMFVAGKRDSETRSDV